MAIVGFGCDQNWWWNYNMNRSMFFRESVETKMFSFGTWPQWIWKLRDQNRISLPNISRSYQNRSYKYFCHVMSWHTWLSEAILAGVSVVLPPKIPPTRRPGRPKTPRTTPLLGPCLAAPILSFSSSENPSIRTIRSKTCMSNAQEPSGWKVLRGEKEQLWFWF